MSIEILAHPPTDRRNDHYPSNRPPLSGDPLVKLPLGSVRARGWLGHQIDLMVEGMHGRLEEISSFLEPDNGWFGTGEPGWEEQPYWFRGFYPLAVLSGDERCRASAARWIEAVLESQDADGYFGAAAHKAVAGKSGKSMPDLWPHMVMLDAVIQHYEHTGDDRVLPFMKAFFEFCRNVPDSEFMPKNVWSDPDRYREDFDDWKPFIQHKRAGDMIPHIFWLYNHTGEEWLLPLAERFFDHIQPPEDEWLDHHIVHFTQRFQYSGVFGALSHDPRHLALTEYWYGQHLGTWGQQPRGIFGADEQIRPGKVDPRQAFETCGMVEFAKSFNLLGRRTGDPVYADRIEDIMLNHFPASHTPDLKALHYLTASNQPQLDSSENHDYRNKRRQIDYSPHLYRCCRHNAAMGWPWYVQNLWQATADNGLAAWTYAASEVSALVGDGTEVTLVADTEYPFETTVDITVRAPKATEFPLYFRVPRWCDGFSAAVNGQTGGPQAPAGSFVRIRREWSDGDAIHIEMPVQLTSTRWPRNGSMTVDRGPLSYSVRIDEEWKRCGGTDEWPEWEVLPKSPWNYGLVLHDGAPRIGAVEVKPAGLQPWTVESAPIVITAAAKRVPGWRIGEDQTVEAVPESPDTSAELVEEIALIPLGCARLRMSCLPAVQ